MTGFLSGENCPKNRILCALLEMVSPSSHKGRFCPLHSQVCNITTKTQEAISLFWDKQIQNKPLPETNVLDKCILRMIFLVSVLAAQHFLVLYPLQNINHLPKSIQIKTTQGVAIIIHILWIWKLKLKRLKQVTQVLQLSRIKDGIATYVLGSHNPVQLTPHRTG